MNTRRLVESLHERAARFEAEQRLLAERATIAERTSIPREMHDVAHRVSQMVLHAGGIELSADDPELARSAARISGIGREALSELREVLGVLHDSSDAEAPVAPQPAMAGDRLIDQWRAARGMFNAEAGRALNMQEGTVKAQLSRTLAKLGMNNRVQAAILAHEAGWV